MEKVQLTQHLDARYGNSEEEILLCNLSYGTRILAGPDRWEKLARFQEPAELPEGDAWLARAHQAHILVGEDPGVAPDFVLRLERQLRDYVEHWTDKPDEKGLLALLQRAESVFRQHHMPSPFQGNPLAAGPLMFEPERLVDFVFDHNQAFLSHDLENRQGLDLELVRLFVGRPAMKIRYEQQFCTPRTTQARASRIRQHLKPGGRVLVLGDDDLVSLALVHQGGDFSVDVLELDSDLVAFLKEKGQGRLTVLEHNLRHGVPESMREAYDLVTTDPPYASQGMRFFLECAVASLAKEPESRLFLSTYPGLIESPQKLWSDLDELGLKIGNRWEHFSRYVYHNSYRVGHLAALRQLGSPLHPTTELLGFPYLYAHFFECSIGL